MLRTNASTWISARISAHSNRHRARRPRQPAPPRGRGSPRGRRTTPGCGRPATGSLLVLDQHRPARQDPAQEQETGSTNVKATLVAADVKGQVAACPDGPVLRLVTSARANPRAGTATPPTRPGRRARSPRSQHALLRCRSPRGQPRPRGTQEEEENGLIPNHRKHQTSLSEEATFWVEYVTSQLLGRDPMYLTAVIAGAGGGGRVNLIMEPLTLVGPTHQAVEPVSMDLLREPLVAVEMGEPAEEPDWQDGCCAPSSRPGGVPGEGRLHPQERTPAGCDVRAECLSTRWPTTSASGASGAGSRSGSAAGCAAPPSDPPRAAAYAGPSLADAAFAGGAQPSTPSTASGSMLRYSATCSTSTSCSRLRQIRRRRRPWASSGRR